MPKPISRAGGADADRGEAGFTLIEVVCVLAIIALLAAIALPAIPHGTSRVRLESFAVETAALLRADHNAAMIRRAEIATIVDAPNRTIKSGASERSVKMPADVMVDAVLANRCNRRPAGATIRHLASGMSCGGVIALRRAGNGYEIRVNWLTGGVEVVPINAL